MAFNLGTAIGYLMLDTSGFTKGFQTAKSQLEIFTNKSLSFNKRMQGLSSGLSIVGSNLTKNITLPLAGLGTVAAKSAIDFESAFTGVRKTVDATEEEYAALEEGMIRMSNKMPQSASDIASVMEIAGQLGIRGTENLLSFTDTMVRLGDSTNLSSEEAATAIARIMNVMGTATEDVGRFGSTIVDLGNNFATTESEITEMANRLAAGGKLAGLTEPQILALATAMSSVGINAEAGGTAMTQTFNAIEKAVANGGDKLQGFADIAGMTSEEFAQAWETDPITAIQSFIQGLGDLEAEGGSAVIALDNLGLSGIRQSDMLKSLSQSGDLLTDTLETANSAWSENNALTQESETRYGTLASKLQILWNNVKNLAISFGNLLMPVIESVIAFIQGFTEKLNNMDETSKKIIVTIIALVAAIGPVLLIIANIVKAITEVQNAFTVVSVLIQNLSVFLGGALSTALTKAVSGIQTLFNVLAANPILIIIAAVVALIAIIVHLWNTNEEFRNAVTEIWNAIVSAIQTAADWIGSAIDSVVAFFQNLGQTAAEVWNTIKSTVVSVVQSIVDTVVAWGSSLYNGAVQAFNQLWQGAKSVWDSISSWVSESWTAIVETVKGFGQALFDAGAHIFTSLWDGIKSVWEAISSWVQEKVGWIANQLSGATSSVSNAAGSVSGSAATGFDYISHDSVWQLHEGEAILSKEENARYRSKNYGSGGDTYNFYSPKALTPTASARAMKKLNKQLVMGMV